MRVLFNPDASGEGIFRTIKAVQYKLAWANYIHTGSFGATAVIEIYESDIDGGT